MTGKVPPGLVLDEVVVVARVVVVVARVVGVSVVVVVWRVVVVAAAVEGVVDDGAAVGAVVGVTLGEERGRLAFVDTVELTAHGSIDVRHHSRWGRASQLKRSRAPTPPELHR